jgi:hypothetical protein
VSRAAAGDRIVVAGGTYLETVLVTKRLSLIGSSQRNGEDDEDGAHESSAGSAATIDATGHDNGVVIKGAAAAGTVLRGFTVRNALLEGVFATQTSRLTIANNHLLDNDKLWNPVNVPLPCRSADDCGEALHLDSVSNSSLVANLIEKNVGGILLTDETGPTFGNTIQGNQVLNNDKDCGITLASHAFNPGRPVTATEGGIYNNKVLHNIAIGNGSAGIGIFAGPPGAAAYGNDVIGNVTKRNGLPGVAIHAHSPFQYVNDNRIVANEIEGNGADPDAGTGAPTGITVWSAVVSIPRTVIAANKISDEYFGIFTVKAVQLVGLETNRYDNVTVHTSIH